MPVKFFVYTVGTVGSSPSQKLVPHMINMLERIWKLWETLPQS